MQIIAEIFTIFLFKTYFRFSFQVLRGGRLELHPRIPKQIQRLIHLTMMETDQRPTFVGLKDDLLEINFKDGIRLGILAILYKNLYCYVLSINFESK